jgi:NAD(P)-dependent dehydrogenase (short-subunit alcohol dehydrogenase family)
MLVRSRPSSETMIGFSSPISSVEEFDVAAAIRFLLSPGARNITGHDVPVDADWDV